MPRSSVRVPVVLLRTVASSMGMESRRTTTVIDFDRYLDMIRGVGEMTGVSVFPRFAIMRDWSDDDVFDYDDVPESERARLAAQVYDCLGQALAEVIAKGVQ